VASELRLVVLARGSDAPDLVAQAHRDVLRPSFTADEIAFGDEFVDEVADQTVVIGLRGDEPVAAAVTDSGSSAPVALLSYLAVRPDQRGSGTGSSMMQKLRQVWVAGVADVVLGEVHDPRCWSEQPDERPEARLRFYERLGARLLTVPWVQPRLHAGGSRVNGMLLLVMWSRHEPDAVAAPWIRSWTTDYFGGAEGVDETSADPTYAALLARIDAADPIAIRPIAELDAMPVLAESA
jgi:hypothetical protein